MQSPKMMSKPGAPPRGPPPAFDDKMPKLTMIKNRSEMPIDTKKAAGSPTKNYHVAAPKFAPEVSRRVDSKMQTKGQPPQFIGSSYTHTPNAAVRPYNAKPTNPTVPLPYSVPTFETYQDSPLLKSRAPNGAILGTWRRDFVNDANVPFLAPDEPVGPDNPVKEINETWTSCWDEAAAGIYYYNKETGEATWLPPEI